MAKKRHPRTEQQEIVPNNKVEAAYLDNSKVYRGGLGNAIFIEEFAMNSAANDLEIMETQEMVWPTKIIKEKKEVWHSLPGTGELIQDFTYRETRVPMTKEEAQAHFFAQAGFEMPSPKKPKQAKKAEVKAVAAPKQRAKKGETK